MATAIGSHRDGKRSNSDRGSVSLHWDRELDGERQVDVDGRCHASEYGPAGPVDNPAPDARQSYHKASVDSRFSGIIGDAGDYAINLYGDTIDLEDESQAGFTTTLDSLKWGLKGENNWMVESERWALRLTGNLEGDDADHTFSGDHHRVTAGFGAQADHHWETFTTTLGGRGDHTSDFDFNPGFSGGLRHALNRHWLLKANGGNSVKSTTGRTSESTTISR